LTQYIVTYDLVRPGQQYPTLLGKLATLKARRVQYSVWVVRWSGSGEQLLHQLLPFVDVNDRLLVNSLGSWASYNAMGDLNAA
jgi:hypothetical protein